MASANKKPSTDRTAGPKQATLDAFATKGDGPGRVAGPSDSAPFSGGLQYSEVKGDLFSCPDSASLGHCVSEDMHMGKGVATLFKRKFGGVEELRAQGTRPWPSHCSCCAATNEPLPLVCLCTSCILALTTPPDIRCCCYR